MTIKRDVLVVDVSKYQGRIEPAQLKAGGVELVIVRAAGGLNEDPKFRQHADATLAGGLALGAYVWDDPILDSQKQVDFWASLFALYPGKISAVFPDYEQWWSNWGEWTQAVQKKLEWALVHSFTPDKLSQHLQKTSQLLQASWLGRMALYTGWGFVTSYAPKMAAWLGQYDLWVAHWGRQVVPGTVMSWEAFKADWLPTYNPLIPPGAREPIGHQFTGDKVLLPGMYADAGPRSPADVSLFNREWLFSGSVPIPQPVPEPLTLESLDRRVTVVEKKLGI
jgi:hypothetical protein